MGGSTSADHALPTMCHCMALASGPAGTLLLPCRFVDIRGASSNRCRSVSGSEVRTVCSYKQLQADPLHHMEEHERAGRTPGSPVDNSALRMHRHVNVMHIGRYELVMGTA